MGSCLSGAGAVAAGASAPPSRYASSCYCYCHHHHHYQNESSSSSFGDAKTSCDDSLSSIEMRVHRVPGRMFLNGSSPAASLFCKQGNRKGGTNQDAMLLWENFCSMDDTVFCGVFDGHGPFGHVVAKKVRDSLPLKLIAEWNRNLHHSSDQFKEVVGFDFRESFLKACKVMDNELKLHHAIDCYCSGTTAVTLIKQGQHLVMANVGDSRAVLGSSRPDDDSLIAAQLTTDLKPDLPSEAERIRLCKGRVFALQNEPGIHRVWLPNADSPGLAMARAFGDFCLKDFGVISVPDVSYHRITHRDQFVVLATDGVWDVLSNKQVVDIVASAATRSCAARTVVETAVQAWRTKLPTAKADDCSVVCLFFDHSHSNLMIPIEEEESRPEQKKHQ